MSKEKIKAAVTLTDPFTGHVQNLVLNATLVSQDATTQTLVLSTDANQNVIQITLTKG